MADKIITGLLNTLLGMGSVFAVLILIAFIISCMAIIPKLMEGKKSAAVKPPVAAPAAAPVKKAEAPVVQPAAKEELVDDLELVAVITAAIAASEHVSTDSFMVRSIKRANTKNRWQRA